MRERTVGSDIAYLPVATPIGVFVVAARNDAVTGGWFEGQKYFPGISAEAGWRQEETPVLRAARDELDAYFAGTLMRFTVPLVPEGTAFQCKVWEALRAVPFGETTTYAALARAIGRPGAFHPVGAAVGRNPMSLFVPCHRALGSDGSLTGYAGGLERKRWLLDHESREPRLFN
ncbi:MAG: methylated-DNA--[protein]-cysteine S-methyltransferase [Rhodanobacter sp.]|nr:MAG: methylated-DNA--[protein]-cysteine S-methyltransferase [Rhodanobacter sp.]TAM13955.1 MAG: methylated-DNA--[protein]-cysteine S-methyltransferase [Rhodanobacter sp.]TAM37797.1 MAG: methylated-DNA--[protein]-cysteine S-methyltransferase [Rhodanobacter sp.]